MNTHRHHRVIPILLVVAATPLAAILLFFVIANLTTRDEPPPDDAALLLPEVTVAEADNAFTEVEAIKKLDADINALAGQPIQDPQLDAVLAGGTWDEDYAAGATEVHRQEIALIIAAAKKKAYQDPIYANPASFSFDLLPSTYIGSPRNAAKYAALAALRSAHAKKPAEGLATALAVVRLGHLMESNQGSLIDYLVGSAVKQIGLSAIRQIALATPVPAATARSTAEALEPYRDSRAGEVMAMKMEYNVFKKYLPRYRRVSTLWSTYHLTSNVDGSVDEPDGNASLEIADDLGLTRFYYLPNQTWRFMIEQTNDRIANAQADCLTLVRDPATRTYLRRYDLTLLFERNVVGKYLAEIGQVSYGGLSTKRCNEAVSISAAQVALAISAFKQETGKLPTTLAALVPKYLGGVPTDPYTGQPMMYQAEKKLLYSLGPKRVDVGGGTPTADWQNQDNPTFVVAQ